MNLSSISRLSLLGAALTVALSLAAHKSAGPATAAPAGQTDMNKQLVVRFYQALNDRNLNELDAIVAPNVVDHNADPRGAPGLPGVKQGLQGFLDAFPDMQFTVENLVGDGDLVSALTVAVGTNSGSLFGIPPSNRVITSSGLDMYRVQNGMITEIWHLDDIVQQLTQQSGN